MREAFLLEADPSLILESAGMIPDAWQAKLLRARPRRAILNCSRQAGKTQVTAGAAIDECLNNAPALVLILSPSQRQSQEAFRTTMQLYHQLGIGDLNPDSESLLRAEMPNGSRIIALPGKEASIRGFSKAALLIIDEASRVPDALYNSVKPMLAVSNGRLLLLSTPFGQRGFFHQEWTQGEGWDRIKITAEQCPRISPEFLESERRSLPSSWFRQEYFGEFASTEDAVFKYEDVMAALSDDVMPLFGTPRTATITSDVKPLFM